MNVQKQTALDIALAYREIETAEKLLAEIREGSSRRQTPDVRDAFGRLCGVLRLSVPDGRDVHRLLEVPYSLAVPIIEAHIAHHRDRVFALSQKARIELGRGGP